MNPLLVFIFIYTMAHAQDLYTEQVQFGTPATYHAQDLYTEQVQFGTPATYHSHSYLEKDEDGLFPAFVSVNTSTAVYNTTMTFLNEFDRTNFDYDMDGYVVDDFDNVLYVTPVEQDNCAHITSRAWALCSQRGCCGGCVFVFKTAECVSWPSSSHYLAFWNNPRGNTCVMSVWNNGRCRGTNSQLNYASQNSDACINVNTGYRPKSWMAIA